jgi:hypothetical protein
MVAAHPLQDAAMVMDGPTAEVAGHPPEVVMAVEAAVMVVVPVADQPLARAIQAPVGIQLPHLRHGPHRVVVGVVPVVEECRRVCR